MAVLNILKLTYEYMHPEGTVRGTWHLISGIYLENGYLFHSISYVVSRKMASAMFSEQSERRSRESEQQRGEFFREFKKGTELYV